MTARVAYKAEHVVDLDSDLILAAEIRSTTDADTQTLADSVLKAEENLQAIGAEQSIEAVVADKGYHAAHTLELCDSLGLRTHIPEPQRTSDWELDGADVQPPSVRMDRRDARMAVPISDSASAQTAISPFLTGPPMNANLTEMLK